MKEKGVQGAAQKKLVSGNSSKVNEVIGSAVQKIMESGSRSKRMGMEQLKENGHGAAKREWGKEQLKEEWGQGAAKRGWG